MAQKGPPEAQRRPTVWRVPRPPPRTQVSNQGSLHRQTQPVSTQEAALNISTYLQTDAPAFLGDSSGIISSILFTLAKKNSESNYTVVMTGDTVKFTPNEMTVFDG